RRNGSDELEFWSAATRSDVEEDGCASAVSGRARRLLLDVAELDPHMDSALVVRHLHAVDVGLVPDVAVLVVECTCLGLCGLGEKPNCEPRGHRPYSNTSEPHRVIPLLGVLVRAH